MALAYSPLWDFPSVEAVQMRIIAPLVAPSSFFRPSSSAVVVVAIHALGGAEHRAFLSRSRWAPHSQGQGHEAGETRRLSSCLRMIMGLPPTAGPIPWELAVWQPDLVSRRITITLWSTRNSSGGSNPTAPSAVTNRPVRRRRRSRRVRRRAAVPVERRAAGKPDDAVLVEVLRLAAATGPGPSVQGLAVSYRNRSNQGPGVGVFSRSIPGGNSGWPPKLSVRFVTAQPSRRG